MQNTTQKTNQRMPGRSSDVVGNELGALPGHMSHPLGVAIDPSGNVYVTSATWFDTTAAVLLMTPQ